ncbi:amino acid permease [Biformimicrobium ophioploci]|uniref:Arginine/agmatine antiporter n=2 Tax=Biformimicrobium ophioploci TaxID=3036711 RepID=A0ABQ6LYF6_9GAMM|nr:amino acid permease [Microbulbifer sp. NKW57]
MIGSGILTMPALLAPYGSYSFLGWAVTGFGAICLALSYSYLSSRKPGLGGPYFYVQEAFGTRFAGFVAWGYWISLVASVAALALSFTGYSKAYLPLISDSTFYSAAFSAVIILFFTAINARGAREASSVQLITTVVKILPLVFLGFAGIMFGEVKEIPAINPGSNSLFHMIAGLCLLVMFAFIGVESATLPSEDTIEPEKTIPRASILGTLTAVTVYVIATLGLMSVIPLSDLQNSASPFADAAQILVGSSGAMIITIGALFAISGTLNVCIMITGTIMTAGARDGIFPRLFSQKNSRGAPVRALLFSSAVGVMLLFFNSYDSLIKSYEYLLVIATFAVMIVYLTTALASIKLQWQDHKQNQEISITQLSIALLATLFTVLALVGTWVVYQ